MASLGFQVILKKLIERGGCDIRRFFFSPDAESASIDAPDGGTLREADIILGSISYELDYINFARLLMEAGIPVYSRDRLGLPIVLVGGVAPSANPLPLAPIADAIHIGDCETGLASYLETFEENLGLLRGPSFIDARKSLLDVWVGQGNAVVSGKENARSEWAIYDDFSTDPGHSIIIAPDSIWGDSFLVEASRGCDVGCKFCLISHNKGTCRNVAFETLRTLLEKHALQAGGIGLIGSAVGSYPHLLEAVRYCVELGKRTGLSSLNFRHAPDELFELLAASGEHKVTLAVETGSARLQEEIGKILPTDLVIDRIRAALDLGMKSVKLYFIVGLPGEEKRDVDESVRLIRDIAEKIDLRSRGGSAELDIGVSCFVPKAGTPWEKKTMLVVPRLKERIEMMRSGLADMPNLRFDAESPEMSLFQGILSIGDESTSEIILSSAKAGKGWRAAFRDAARSSGWLDRILEER
jgi:radical SAM superfamily enzyme YgiQ (UPF0313 family)